MFTSVLSIGRAYRHITQKLIVDLEYIDISPDFTLIKHD
jgi:hypothetical protein